MNHQTIAKPDAGLLRRAVSLRVSARARLAALKLYSEQWNARPHATKIDWKTARTFTGGIAPRYPETAGRWGDDDGRRDAHGAAYRMPFYSDAFPFEIVGEAGDSAFMRTVRDTTGYYCDDYQDDACVPVVLAYRLPRRIARARGDMRRVFVPGWKMTDCDGVTCYPLDTYTTDARDFADTVDCGRACLPRAARDAMHAAHHYAERIAEDEREYQERALLENEREECHATVRSVRRDTLALLRELRPLRKYAGINAPAVCAALLATIKENLREIATARARIAEITEELR